MWPSVCDIRTHDDSPDDRRRDADTRQQMRTWTWECHEMRRWQSDAKRGGVCCCDTGKEFDTYVASEPYEPTLSVTTPTIAARSSVPIQAKGSIKRPYCTIQTDTETPKWLCNVHERGEGTGRSILTERRDTWRRDTGRRFLYVQCAWVEGSHKSRYTTLAKQCWA
jgi:hypothetical protein